MNNQQLNSRQQAILASNHAAVKVVAGLTGRITRILSQAIARVRRRLSAISSRFSGIHAKIWEQMPRLQTLLKGINLRFPSIEQWAHLHLVPLVRLDWSTFTHRASQIWERALWLCRVFKRGLAALATMNWFSDDEAPIELICWAGGEIPPDRDELDDAFTEYYEDRLRELEEELSGAFQERRPLLQEAFANHRNERYLSSIPLFLGLADGICQQRFSHSPFSKDGRKRLVRALTGGLDDVLLEPLRSDSPLWRSQKEWDADSTELNRHATVHGESLSHGTKINSLKAISFLSYVCSLEPNANS